MKSLLVFMLCSFPVFSQAILEDWQCGTATVVASPVGGPTTITCSAPHGFANGQTILITNATGRWTRLNTRWEVLLKYTMSSTGTTMYVNDTSQMDPTPGRSWVIYPETAYPQCAEGKETVRMVSISDSRALVVQRGPTAHPHCNEDKMWGPLSSPNSWTITTNAQSPNTFTIPLDSSNFGSFEGQSIKIVRAWPYPNEPAPYYFYDGADGSPVAMSPTPEGYQHFTIDGCPDKTDAIRCSFAYGDTVNQKGYFDYQTVKNVVVSKGVGYIHLKAPFVQTSLTSQTRTFQPRELFWLWGMNEPDASFGTLNRPWMIGKIINDTIQVYGMGTAGVPDGKYTRITHLTKNFIFPILADFYTGMGSPGLINIYGYPSAFIQSMAKPSGAPFNPTMNRYRLWMEWGAAMSSIPMEWGTYVYELPSMSPYHGYHTINLDTVPDEWEQEEFAMVPHHLVGSGAGVPQGNDPSYNGWLGYPAWNGETTHYMDGNGNTYLNLSSIYAVPGAQSGYIGPLYLDTATAEPDEWTPARATRYNPATGAYHLNVVAPANLVVPLTAQFYYSTAGDIKTLGLSSAIPAGSAVTTLLPNTWAYQWNYDSPAMPRQSQIWFAVRPVMPVTGVSGAGQSPIIMTFDADPNMAVGDHITVSGVGGNANANCTNCKITRVYRRHFWFRRDPAPGQPKPHGPLKSIVSDGSSCVANLEGPSHMVPGWRIGVTGVPPGGPGNESGSGSTSVTWFNVSSAILNTFTFSCPGTTPGTYDTGADPRNGIYMGIVADPAIAIAGIGSGNWDSQVTGTAVSTEDFKNFTEINFQPPPVMPAP